MQKNRAKILLFIKLPPPLTGATLMNNFVAKSTLLNEVFDFHVIAVSYKSHLKPNKMLFFKKLLIFIRLISNLTYSITRFKPSIVYFQISPIGMAFYRDCLFILFIKLLGKKIVFHLHGKGIRNYIGKSRIKKKIYKWAFNNSSVICLSDRLIYDIEEVVQVSPYIVNNGIPLSEQPNHLRQINMDRVTRILFFSNLIISKGIFDYLDAISLLVKKSILINCCIVGDEAELNSSQLQDEIKARNLTNIVSYLGAKYDQDKFTTYYQSDILVYPSFNDAWGLVILEAMQSALPVIATREGAIPDMIDDGITGFLVDKHSPEQLAEKIEILVTNPELRKRMGESGRKKFLEKYTLEVFERNMCEVFKSVMDTKTK